MGGAKGCTTGRRNVERYRVGPRLDHGSVYLGAGGDRLRSMRKTARKSRLPEMNCLEDCEVCKTVAVEALATEEPQGDTTA